MQLVALLGVCCFERFSWVYAAVRFHVDQGPRAHFHILLCRSSWLMQRSATTTRSPRMPYPASQVMLFQLVMSAARLVIVGDPVRCIAAVRPYVA